MGRNYLVAALFMGLLWISCEKKVAPPVTDLTTPTTVVTPKDTPTLTVNMGKHYYFTPTATYKQHILSIRGEYISGPIASDPSTWYITLSFYAKDTGTYLLSNKNRAGYSIGYYIENIRESWQTDSVHTGLVNLTALDTIHHRASGTFSFIGGTLIPYLGPATYACNGTFANITW